jgi:pimeloyl-ACP methyl ester carboxylesterase
MDSRSRAPTVRGPEARDGRSTVACRRLGARDGSHVRSPDAVLDGVRRELERRTGVPFAEVDSIDAARSFANPVLLVQDEDDREVPFWIGEAYASAMPHAETMWTKGLGHRRVLKDPDVLAAVAEFVAPTPSAQWVRSAS